MKHTYYILLIMLFPFIGISQDVIADAKLSISSVATNNTSEHVLAKKEDGTLVIRSAGSLLDNQRTWQTDLQLANEGRSCHPRTPIIIQSLLSHGYTLAYLITISSIGDLLAAGVSIEDLLAEGVSYGSILSEGSFPIVFPGLIAAGATADLLAAGYPIGTLIAAGASATDLLAAGASVVDLLAAGVSVEALIVGGASTADLVAAGASIADMLAAGITASELFALGVTLEQLVTGNVPVADLIALGFTVPQLLDAGESLLDLVDYGVLVQELLDLDQTPIALFNAGIVVDSLYGKLYAGGMIFYLNTGTGNGYVSDITTETTTEWGCFGTAIAGADGTVIGTGTQNTIDIETGCTTANTAADFCTNLSVNGFNDWFLPSLKELEEMYDNIGNGAPVPNTNIGGFTLDFHWSSSEQTDNAAILVGFTSGIVSGNTKAANHVVRAIRAF